MLIPFKNLLIHKKIKGIIHVGAHELEEMKDYQSKNIGKIIWIEANPSKYEYIREKIALYDEMILGEFAAGSTNGNIQLNIANNGQSSSVLELGTHKTSYPKIKYNSKIQVVMGKIDDWIKKNKIKKQFYNFVNIDIQGFEIEALKGMKKQLKFADYIYLEVNFQQVYMKCSQLKDIDTFLHVYNFKRVGIYRTGKGWGDAIYVKEFIFLSKIYYFVLIPLIRIIGLPIKVLKRILIRK
tara:strand:- start:669 stop:1385 length:717 start_codon:yes stop_codon:yes gene_type:complete